MTDAADPVENPTVLDDTNTIVCPACAAILNMLTQAQHFAWHWDIENRMRELAGGRRPGGRPTVTGAPYPPGTVPSNEPLQ